MIIPAPILPVKEIEERLKIIFSDGISDRGYLVREMAAKTIFVMLYMDTIEGTDRWLSPKQIIRMCDAQATEQDEDSRNGYFANSTKSGYQHTSGTTWYKDNTREPIRDETLRQGLVSKGAAIMRTDIPTTSPKGRYALKQHFAELFTLSKEDFQEKIEEWKNKHLSRAELARVRILQGMGNSDDDVVMEFPGGGTHKMSAGPSSIITKAIIEDFSNIHLIKPVVLWVSESGNKVVSKNEELMIEIGLPIDQQTLLPDVVLADLGREEILIIYIEVVATDGPITEERKQVLLENAISAGYKDSQILFISAFKSRDSAPLKSRLSAIATDSLIWCMSEPELLIWLGQNQEKPFVID